MVPEGWKKSSIGGIGRVVTGTTPSTTSAEYYGGEIPFIAPGDLGKTLYVYDANRTLTAEGLVQAKSLPPGAVLFTCIGATIGKSAIAGRVLATNQQINAVICDPEKADSEFVYYLLDIRAESIRRLAGTQAIPIVNKSTFEDVTAPFPPLPEQRKIARILSTWDEAIEKLEKLLAAKRQRKKGLMQRLLTGRVRLPGFAKGWHVCQLREVTRECTIRNGTRLGVECVMAVNKAQGLIPMREQTIGASLERYKVVPRQGFAYNPMRLNIGSLARNIGDDVLVSPDYVVFLCREERLDPDFLDHYRRTLEWSKFVETSGNGTVRVRIYYSDLATMRLLLPHIEEQRAISSILNISDQEIHLLKSQLAALQTQKRGLMQKMLTGAWRVNVES